MAEWRIVPGWETRYEVSSDGRVRSMDMVVPCARGGVGVLKGRELVLVKKSGRYLCVTLAQAQRREQRFVHDIVAAAFIGPKPEGMQTRHLNDDKTNNAKDNIAYGTLEEQEADRQRNGRTPKGERHGMARLTKNDITVIRSGKHTAAEAAVEFNVTKARVWAIRTNRVWKD